MTHGAVDWYAARAAGVVAYVLLTAVVLVGVTLAGQLRLKTWPRFAVTDLHRFGSLLVGVFVGLHVLTIALDTYTPFSLTQLAVPFTSSYRPVWVALGIVSAELLLAVAVTNALRERIPYRWWRRAHFATFVIWAGATVHGIGAGTDSSAVWLAAIYVVAVASVFAALVWRIFARRVRPFPLGGLAAAAAVAGAAMTLAVGALPHGGTARHVTAAVAVVPASLTDSFTGAITQQNGSAASLVSVTGTGTGSRSVAVRIDLVTEDGQTIDSSSLQVKDVATGSVCTGTVASIDASGFSGSCSFPGSGSRNVTGTWQLANGRSVSGDVTLSS
jgi:Ferric reductase like transmembrane component